MTPEERPREHKQVIYRFKALLKSGMHILDNKDIQRIKEAYKLAAEVHKDMRRSSGEPYLFHPVAVARIVLEEIGLGATSVIAALLHDTTRFGGLTLAEIEQRFGKDVSAIVAGLNRIAEINHSKDADQSENYRNLIISISEDIRVILIKLADRLEIMRSLNHFTKEQQASKARETFNLYAPLAHKLGLYKVKSEMEDLSMKFTENEAYKSIIKKLRNTTVARNKFIREFMEPIEEKLNLQGLNFEIKGRTKSVYSIWKKIQKQNVPFEKIYDVFAIRIILDTPKDKEKTECWRVYSTVTDKYIPNPSRLRDWVSVPKSTGYESLHTTVVGPDGRWVEVQIRSKRMDEIAERGLAAHWRYKGIRQEAGIDEWLSQIRDIIETPDISPEEMVNSFKLNLHSQEIFIFTPTGDLKKLPVGATVLDFAFDIHSQVGYHCMGAKVNQKNATIREELKNGDLVEIITSKNQKPKKDWLNFVVTSKAKSKIKQSLKENEMQVADLGKEMLARRLKNWKMTLDDTTVSLLIKHYKLKDATVLYSSIFHEKIELSDIKLVLLGDKQPEQAEPQKRVVEHRVTKFDDYLIIDERLDNVDYRLAKCCNPIPGDEVFGFVTIGEGIKIHRNTCPNADRLRDKYGYRIMKAKWREQTESGAFQVTIKIVGYDELGIVNRISEIVSKEMKLNMRAISIESKGNSFVGILKVLIEHTNQLGNLLSKLQKTAGIQRAIRVNR
ncbi:RelA/SpoT family protein [Williamwhitmania taraxaci]|uniref:GTP pyrophosphokinase n=1 Tax=Williamwhitmania taraxaci TaxID=1640674 RepID=A0A1G6J3B7_9BACT|nr:RelA/SpoT family protein [Williamwhitmania taraxaci]SDC13137.1 GTP pyrophosphokinase [Williamwhitmania taraxaci]